MHRAVFSPSVTDSPMLDYEDPDGNRLQFRPLCLAYLDYASGKAAMICVTKQSIGVVQGSQVLYSDAFTDGIKADVAVTYRVGSLECDIILRAQLPSPAIYSLNPDTCRLQVWHELLGDVPAPKVKTTSFIYQETDAAIRQAYAEPDFTDDFISFGKMQFGRGKAFMIDPTIPQAGDFVEEPSVGKEWATTPEGRRFIIESVELSRLAPMMSGLPTVGINNPDGRARLSERATLSQNAGAVGTSRPTL